MTKESSLDNAVLLNNCYIIGLESNKDDYKIDEDRFHINHGEAKNPIFSFLKNEEIIFNSREIIDQILGYVCISYKDLIIYSGINSCWRMTCQQSNIWLN